jgi:hypothetical protein
MQVLEVGDKEFWPPRVDDGQALVREWLAAHGVEANDVYRVELHVVDLPTIRVFRHARNADGKRFMDPKSVEEYEATGDERVLDVAVLPPFDVAMRMPPPVPFRTVGPDE